MDSLKWRGIHVILTTPFNADLSLNIEGHRRNVRAAAASGAHVLVALGTQGEFHSVGMDERMQIAEVTVQEAGGLPVVIGCSHSHTLEAVALAKHARSAGADAVMLTPPYFAQVNAESVKDHTLRVARDADIGVFLYNAPERAGFNWTPDLVLDLAEADDRIIGIKQASSNAQELAETVSLVGTRMAVIGGSEAMIYQTLSLGMIGCTSTTASFHAAPFVEIYESVLEDRYVEARDRFMLLAPLRSAFKATGHAAGVKIGMDMVGLDGGPVRPPLAVPSESARNMLLKAFDSIGLESRAPAATPG